MATEVVGFHHVIAEAGDRRIFDGAALEQGQEGVAVGLRDELALVVEQLQGIPLARIVAGCQDDPPAGPFFRNGHFDRRRGRQPQVDDRDAQCAQGIDHQVADDLSRNAGVTTDHHLGRTAALQQPIAVGGGALDDVLRGQVLAGPAADRSTYSGNGFYQSQGSTVWSENAQG